MSALIRALQQPALYPHLADRVELIETHISWVLLAGDFAYKIRKPVDLGFLDFSTLEKRRQDCEEELRLNRRLAPELYLDLVSISGRPAQPRLDGQGPPFEYAVRMRRFAQADLLSLQQARGRLSGEDMDALARLLAEFHHQAPVATAETPFGRVEALEAAITANFTTIDRHLPANDTEARRNLAALKTWSQESLGRLRPLLNRRRTVGRVREGHGDLHLGNMVRLDGRIRPFDCIEFNPDLRWLDCLNDLAFALMDLEHRGEQALANILLDRYLSESGDYDGVPLLPLFKTYRALVRAKVALLSGDDTEQQRLYHRYAELATAYTRARPPRLLLMQGVSGSGKSWLSARLLERYGAIRLRSDVERRRLCPQQEARYSADTTRRVYARLLQLTGPLLRAGATVLVDATFLRVTQRRPFFELARSLTIPVHLICCTADDERLDRRIQGRRQSRDPSEATPAVRLTQQQNAEALTETEQAFAWRVDTEEPGLIERLGRLWEAGDPLQRGAETSSS